MTNRHSQHVNSAARLSRSGRPDQAERLCRRVLREDGRNSDALHLLGLAVHQLGHSKSAAGYIAKAIEIEPGVPQYHCSLGNILQHLGRHEEATVCYGRALSLRPDYVQARFQLANSLYALARYKAAVQHYVGVIEVAPESAEAFQNLGHASVALGCTEEAIAFFRHAAGLRPEDPEPWVNLAAALRKAGQHDEAAACCREIMRRNPPSAPVQAALGGVFFELGMREQAGAAWERALALDPGHAQACCNLAAVRLGQKDAAESERLSRRALRLRPQYPEALNNLGEALAFQDKLREALACFEDAVWLKPGFAAGWRNRADAAKLLMDFAGAEQWYREALRLSPADPYTNLNHALLLLATGRFEQGLEKYEARLPAIDSAAWQGQDLSGRTILVRAEQGLGDTIHFARYLQMLKDRGAAQVVFECQARLHTLFRDLPGPDALIGTGAAPPPFDFHAFLMSLPHRFGTREDSIPGRCPYIRPDPERARAWAEKLGRGAGMRIGLSWAGSAAHPNDRRRSMSFADMEPLLGAPDIEWVSLQRGEAAWQLACSKWTGAVRQIEHEGNDIADTAAIIANLDLVVSVDTMVAHLAGALGKPVWLLLSAVPDWRWMLGREDSPWYPTMRLFRQTRPGDWAGIIERVKEALEKRE